MCRQLYITLLSIRICIPEYRNVKSASADVETLIPELPLFIMLQYNTTYRQMKMFQIINIAFDIRISMLIQTTNV